MENEITIYLQKLFKELTKGIGVVKLCLKMKKEVENWKTVLLTFIETIDEPLRKKGLKWAVMGSVASVLQGCKLEPNDIDILVEDPKTVHIISSYLANFYVDKKDGTPFDEEQKWFSSKEQPVYEGLGPYGFSWVYAKWKINSVFVEATHKLPPKDHPYMNESIWESGPNVWSYIKEVSFKGYQIPVIPLEIQLDTNFEREFNERIDQIIKIFKIKGYNEDLISKVLNKKNKKNLMRVLEQP